MSTRARQFACHRKHRCLYALATFVSFGIVFCHSQECRAQSLSDVLAHVYQSDPKLLAERANLKSVDEKLAQARADWLPVISAQASAGEVRDRVTGVPNQAAAGLNQIPDRSYNISIVQPIYQGGRVVAETKEANDSIKAERAHLAGTEASVFTAAATAFLNFVRDRKAYELALGNEQSSMTEMNGAAEKFKRGEGSRLDVAQSASAHAMAVIALEQARAQLNASEGALKALAGDSPAATEYPPPLGLNLSKDEAIRQANLNNPSVLEARYTSLVAANEVTIAKSSGRPTLSLRAEDEHEEGNLVAGERENIQAVTLQLRVPIFNGGKTRSTVVQAEDKRASSNYQLQDAVKTAEQQASSDWELLQAQRLSRKSFEAEIEADKLAVVGTEKQSTTGEKTILDVLQARQTLYQAESAYIKAEHDELLQEFALAADIGACNAVGLKIDVDKYDPDKHLREVKRRVIPILGLRDH